MGFSSRRDLLAALVCLGLGVLICGCKKSESSSPTGGNAGISSSGNPITAPVDSRAAVSKAQKTAIKTLDIAQVNQAIQLFREQEERFPKDLQELVQKHYLGSVPAPPYGMKYQYDATSGQVRVIK